MDSLYSCSFVGGEGKIEWQCWSGEWPDRCGWVSRRGGFRTNH